MKVLGVHGGVSLNQHDAGAAVVIDGQIASVCEEERFTRVKMSRGHLPIRSIPKALEAAGLKINDIDVVAHAGASYPDLKDRLSRWMNYYYGHCPEIKIIHHQYAHLASAFFCSPFQDATCISYDYVGDQISLYVALGKGNSLKVLREAGIEESLGLFYCIMTSFLGFEVLEGEYKVMGLAPYGKPTSNLDFLARVTDKGVFVDRSYFDSDPAIRSPFEPYFNKKLIERLGEPRMPSAPLEQRHFDLAASTQKKLEELVTYIVKESIKETSSENLCLAGGVALNCSANLSILQSVLDVKNLFVQPASSDRGLALGAALAVSAESDGRPDPLSTVAYGPVYSEGTIKEALLLSGVSYVHLEDSELFESIAKELSNGAIVGWFQGRSEFGPRALGQRSIIADPRDKMMKDKINSRIKFREEFRPFAPAVLEERASDVFEMKGASPFMTVAYPVRQDWQKKIPAVTHINGTGRVQTVSKLSNSKFWGLISEFNKITGVPVLLNTSFNVKGEPIVERPSDAISTFFACGLDILVLENFVIRKKK